MVSPKTRERTSFSGSMFLFFLSLGLEGIFLPLSLTNCVGLKLPLLVGRHILVFTHHTSISIPSIFFYFYFLFNNGIRVTKTKTNKTGCAANNKTQTKKSDTEMVMETNSRQ